MILKNHMKNLFLIIPIVIIFSSCTSFIESDSKTYQMVSYFDLRDRESFIQVTNVASTSARLHIQIFNVPDNCNENNFFDQYTPNDTHVYNLKDILTNDGNPSGIVLPNEAYGLVIVTVIGMDGLSDDNLVQIVGNSRILDNKGFEYRTNLLGLGNPDFDPQNVPVNEFQEITFNYNMQGNTGFSDVIGFTLSDVGDGFAEVLSADILSTWLLVDVDILDLEENIFSCRNVIFACTDDDNPLRTELLAEVSQEEEGVSVASFEYGINDVLPHSKDGEVLCPGNNIKEGFVKLSPIAIEDTGGIGIDSFGIYVGLNNGDGRGTMDSYWTSNIYVDTENIDGI